MEISIKEEIKIKRKLLGLSQKALADYIGTSQGSVAWWETGRSKPSQKQIEDIDYIYHELMREEDGVDPDDPKHMILGYLMWVKMPLCKEKAEKDQMMSLILDTIKNS